jgi:putative transposase
MEEHRTVFPVRMMSEVLNVSASGYYKWRKDEQSPREAFDDLLIDLIRVLYAELQEVLSIKG